MATIQMTAWARNDQRRFLLRTVLLLVPELMGATPEEVEMDAAQDGRTAQTFGLFLTLLGGTLGPGLTLGRGLAVGVELVFVSLDEGTGSDAGGSSNSAAGSAGRGQVIRR